MNSALPRWLVFGPAPLAVTLGVLVLLSSGQAAAQGATISGRVTDAESQQPVGEVQVDVITGSRERVASAHTDDQGRFEITGPPAGVYALVFTRLGYELR